MPEQGETRDRRHTRYLRYAAEARELAARTTNSVREHHMRVALAWEAKARTLAPRLLQGKPKLLLVGGRVQVGSGDADHAPLALGYRTEAVRVRLLANGIAHIGLQPEGVQDFEALAHSLDEPQA